MRSSNHRESVDRAFDASRAKRKRHEKNHEEQSDAPHKRMEAPQVSYPRCDVIGGEEPDDLDKTVLRAYRSLGYGNTSTDFHGLCWIAVGRQIWAGFNGTGASEI